MVGHVFDWLILTTDKGSDLGVTISKHLLRDGVCHRTLCSVTTHLSGRYPPPQ